MPISFEDNSLDGTRGTGVPLDPQSFLPEDEQLLDGGARNLPPPDEDDPE